MESGDLTYEELKHLRNVSRTVDDILEQSLKNRENLEQTFKRLFPELIRLTGATGVAITSLDEELSVQTWHHGDFGGTFPGTLLD